MKVVLIKDVPRVGSKGSVVDVSEGYARNYLIKQGLATEAKKATLTELENRVKLSQKKKQRELDAEFAFAGKHKEQAFKIILKANEHGHLFEKISADKLAKIINENTGLSLQAKQLQGDFPINSVGRYEIGLMVDDKLMRIIVEVASL